MVYFSLGTAPAKIAHQIPTVVIVYGLRSVKNSPSLDSIMDYLISTKLIFVSFILRQIQSERDFVSWFKTNLRCSILGQAIQYKSKLSVFKRVQSPPNKPLELKSIYARFCEPEVQETGLIWVILLPNSVQIQWYIDLPASFSIHWAHSMIYALPWGIRQQTVKSCTPACLAAVVVSIVGGLAPSV
jgi:hypothetical protein